MNAPPPPQSRIETFKLLAPAGMTGREFLSSPSVTAARPRAKTKRHRR